MYVPVSSREAGLYSYFHRVRRVPLQVLAKATGRSLRTVWKYATGSGRVSRELRQGKLQIRHSLDKRYYIQRIRAVFELLLLGEGEDPP